MNRQAGISVSAQTREFCEKVLNESTVFFSELKQPAELAGKTTRRQSGWRQEYMSKLNSTSFYHDEQWLTIMALWGLLAGGKREQNPFLQLLCEEWPSEAVNDVLTRAYLGRPAGNPKPTFVSLPKAFLEFQLPEVLKYREYVIKGLSARTDSTPHHPYADRSEILEHKLAGDRPSIEGNTHLDALLVDESDNNKASCVFIEAKFLSDISKDITYVPVRNQIARMIDSAMAALATPRNTGSDEEEKDQPDIDRMWFILLTPGVFRTAKFGGVPAGPEVISSEFQPQRGRFYCYKMNDYLDGKKLQADLPHWKLSPAQWKKLSSRIGWLTFEDIVSVVQQRNLLPTNLEKQFTEFFRKRGIIVP